MGADSEKKNVKQEDAEAPILRFTRESRWILLTQLLLRSFRCGTCDSLLITRHDSSFLSASTWVNLQNSVFYNCTSSNLINGVCWWSRRLMGSKSWLLPQIRWRFVRTICRVKSLGVFKILNKLTECDGIYTINYRLNR